MQCYFAILVLPHSSLDARMNVRKNCTSNLISDARLLVQLQVIKMLQRMLNVDKIILCLFEPSVYLFPTTDAMLFSTSTMQHQMQTVKNGLWNVLNCKQRKKKACQKSIRYSAISMSMISLKSLANFSASVLVGLGNGLLANPP